MPPRVNHSAPSRGTAATIPDHETPPTDPRIRARRVVATNVAAITLAPFLYLTGQTWFRDIHNLRATTRAEQWVLLAQWIPLAVLAVIGLTLAAITFGARYARGTGDTALNWWAYSNGLAAFYCAYHAWFGTPDGYSVADSIPWTLPLGAAALALTAATVHASIFDAANARNAVTTATPLT